jgi:hypothetical protein
MLMADAMALALASDSPAPSLASVWSARRFPHWDIDEGRIKRIHTTTVRGYTNLPFTPT